MNHLLDETDDREDHASRGGDREITLGTTMILLIFFALAVYGAVLFGFGYSLGSKHTGGTSGAMAAAPTTSGSSNNFKPAPGSPAGSSPQPKASAADFGDSTPVTAPVKVDPPQAKPSRAAAPDDPALKPRPSTANTTAPAAVPMPVATPTGTVVVQVAAVSHQEDAELIATTLKRRGYVVTVHNESDKLFHVQVGPFATHKDADTMKAKLLADGFNAYIK